jgi:hypothetical protein
MAYLKNSKNALQFSEDPLDKYSTCYAYCKEVASSKGGDFPINVANQVTAWFIEESGDVDIPGSEARKLAVPDAQRGPTKMVPDVSLKTPVEKATLPLRKCDSFLIALRNPQ